jgi:acetolactate synthase small subunit
VSTGHRQDRMVVLMDDSLTAVNRVVSLLRARQCEIEALTICAADTPALRMTFRLVSGPGAEQVASWLVRCQEVRHAEIETGDRIG